MSRTATKQTVSITASSTTTGKLSYGNAIAGRFKLPAGATTTLITWYEAPESGDTPLPSMDSSDPPVALTQTVAAGKWYPIPTDLAGARWLFPVGDVATILEVVLKD